MLKKILIMLILAILLAISVQAKPPQDCYTGCPDVNHNDNIDEFDLVLVALHFGKDVEPDSPYKINRTPNTVTKVVNKFVGKDDLSCVGESFGENVKDFPVCKKEKDKLLAKNCACADVNRNKEVDIFDLVLVSGNFGSKEPKYKIKKEKDNDVVGVEDLVCVGQSFGKPGAEVGCKYCSDCGDGAINKCDKKECIGLGDCEYTPNDFPLLGETLIGGKCGEREEDIIIEKDFGVVKFDSKEIYSITLQFEFPSNPGVTYIGLYTNNFVVPIQIHEMSISDSEFFTNVIEPIKKKGVSEGIEYVYDRLSNTYCTRKFYDFPHEAGCIWYSNNKLVAVSKDIKISEINNPKQMEEISKQFDEILDAYLKKYPSSLNPEKVAKEEAKLEAEKCTDSDGKDYLKKGKISAGDFTAEDYCVPSDPNKALLAEYMCYDKYGKDVFGEAEAFGPELTTSKVLNEQLDFYNKRITLTKIEQNSVTFTIDDHKKTISIKELAEIGNTGILIKLDNVFNDPLGKLGLLAQFSVGNKYYFAGSYTCPNGCENGACEKEPKEIPLFQKIIGKFEGNFDKDGKIYHLVVEPAKLSLHIIHESETQKTTDFLALQKSDVENVFISELWYIGKVAYKIKADINTKKAIIEKVAVECTDSDGGYNPLEKGKSTGLFGADRQIGFIWGENPNKCSARLDENLPYSIINDCCTDSENSNQLNEVFCDEKGILQSVGYKCPNGCEEGACKKEPIEKQELERRSDLNKDGCVDVFDLVKVVEYIKNPNPLGDVNKDGLNNIKDAEIVGNNLNKGDCKQKQIKCTDSDKSPVYTSAPLSLPLVSENYPDLFIKGDVVGLFEPSTSKNTITDFCINDYVLDEAFCDDNREWRYIQIHCPAGCKDEDDACIKEKPGVYDVKCIDSDGWDDLNAVDYYTKGILKQTYLIVDDKTKEEKKEELTDKCLIKLVEEKQQPKITYVPSCKADEDCYVEEYYCFEKYDVTPNILGTSHSSNRFKCPNGCEDGECNRFDAKCKDSDDGKNYNVIGTVTYSDGGQNTDTCIDESGNTVQSGPKLVEYSCKGYGKEEHTCPNGCEDGKCIKEPKEGDKKPNLIIENINLDYIESIVGEPKRDPFYSMTIYVKNIGRLPASKSKLKIIITPKQPQVGWSDDVKIYNMYGGFISSIPHHDLVAGDLLLPEQRERYTDYFNPSEEGKVTIEAIADIDGEVIESNENDNALKKTFDVKKILDITKVKKGPIQ